MELVHELFSKQLHDRSGFDCGVPELNTYLQKQLTQDVKKSLCKAYVVHDNGAIIGFYTLSPGALQYKVPGTPYPETSGFLIGRIAVDSKHQGKGRGKELLSLALRRSLEWQIATAGRVVYLHAKNDKAKWFYERQGFQAISPDSYCLYIKIDNLMQSLSISFEDDGG